MFPSSAADHRKRNLGFQETLGKKKRIVTKDNSNLLEESKWIEGIFYSLVF